MADSATKNWEIRFEMSCGARSEACEMLKIDKYMLKEC